MTDLLLAVLCSLCVGVIFKVAALRDLDRVALLTVNYAVAVGLASVLLRGQAAPWEALAVPGLLALGVGTGILFIVGYLAFGYAVEVAGMSLAVGVMRVSVVVPVTASWLIWREIPTSGQGVGLGLAALAFFLIAYRPAAASVHGRALREFGVLAALFSVNGLADVLIKSFNELYGATYETASFLLIVFSVAFVLGAIPTVRTGLRTQRWPSPQTLGLGLALGAFNYGSAEFFLRAIDVLPGPLVFPANHIALILGSALLGVTIWRERPSRLNWAGLGLAAAALLLLSL
ncbi:MAG: hypothetical protein AAF970_09610 [Bacteroidota bacterium]